MQLLGFRYNITWSILQNVWRFGGRFVKKEWGYSGMKRYFHHTCVLCVYCYVYVCSVCVCLCECKYINKMSACRRWFVHIAYTRINMNAVSITNKVCGWTYAPLLYEWSFLNIIRSHRKIDPQKFDVNYKLTNRELRKQLYKMYTEISWCRNNQVEYQLQVIQRCEIISIQNMKRTAQTSTATMLIRLSHVIVLLF